MAQGHGCVRMLYRVLCLALLCSAPAAAGIAPLPQPSVTGLPSVEGAPLPALLYGFRYTQDPVPHPMSAADGDWKWDATGEGCVNAGDWDDPFPSGKSTRAPAFCIPQPCVALLSPDELADEVYGRDIRDGEYDTYLRRLEDACGEIPVSPVSMEAEIDFGELLRLSSLDWLSFLPTEVLYFPGEDEVPGAPSVVASNYRSEVQRTSLKGISRHDFRTAIRPVDLRAPWRRWTFGGLTSVPRRSVFSYSAPPWFLAFGGGAPGGGIGGGPEKLPSTFTPENRFDPGKPPSIPGTPSDPNIPGDPGGPGDLTDNGKTSQPASVPLPGTLPMLLAAIGAMAGGRRLRARS
jgi:hypothetical protein